MSDLLSLTADLVNIPSISGNEKQIADYIESELRQISRLEVSRFGDNLIARTNLDRKHRLLLAGHTDTVQTHTRSLSLARARTHAHTHTQPHTHAHSVSLSLAHPFTRSPFANTQRIINAHVHSLHVLYVKAGTHNH